MSSKGIKGTGVLSEQEEGRIVELLYLEELTLTMIGKRVQRNTSIIGDVNKRHGIRTYLNSSKWVQGPGWNGGQA